jgi:predicted RNA-binding protein YlxR (DUF448 family)
VPRVRRVPQRTCVGCGEVEGKRELVRVVRTPAGEVEIDPSGKRNGRGAYVHHGQECLDRALAGRLSRALRCELNPERAAALRAGFAAYEAQVAAARRTPRVHRAPVPPPGLRPRTRS